MDAKGDGQVSSISAPPVLLPANEKPLSSPASAQDPTARAPAIAPSVQSSIITPPPQINIVTAPSAPAPATPKPAPATMTPIRVAPVPKQAKKKSFAPLFVILGVVLVLTGVVLIVVWLTVWRKKKWSCTDDGKCVRSKDGPFETEEECAEACVESTPTPTVIGTRVDLNCNKVDETTYELSTSDSFADLLAFFLPSSTGLTLDVSVTGGDLIDGFTVEYLHVDETSVTFGVNVLNDELVPATTYDVFVWYASPSTESTEAMTENVQFSTTAETGYTADATAPKGLTLFPTKSTLLGQPEVDILEVFWTPTQQHVVWTEPLTVPITIQVVVSEQGANELGTSQLRATSSKRRKISNNAFFSK